jgi:phosphatidylglycerophosphatase A
MKFFERMAIFLATGFFIGYIPFAPGTFGTLIGMPLCYLMTRLHVGLALTGAVFFIFVAIGLASMAEKISKQKDPAHIVIDEIAGVLVAFVGVPFNLLTALCGFALFRAFDILKPFPIRLLERKISGGSGIVFDDVLAGIYANLTLRLVLVLFPAMVWC